jgi:hypothetical protein
MNDSTNVRVIADNIRKLEKMVKEAGSELPNPGAGDTGKILKVGSGGYELATDYATVDYSTSETNTGRKWIDGREVFFIVISGTFPEITTTTTELIGTIDTDLEIIDAEAVVHKTNNQATKTSFAINYTKSSGEVTMGSVTTAYSEGEYICLVYYVKPAPVPGNETKKKTTRKDKSE